MFSNSPSFQFLPLFLSLFLMYTSPLVFPTPRCPISFTSLCSINYSFSLMSLTALTISYFLSDQILKQHVCLHSIHFEAINHSFLNFLNSKSHILLSLLHFTHSFCYLPPLLYLKLISKVIQRPPKGQPRNPSPVLISLNRNRHPSCQHDQPSFLLKNLSSTFTTLSPVFCCLYDHSWVLLHPHPL